MNQLVPSFSYRPFALNEVEIVHGARPDGLTDQEYNRTLLKTLDEMKEIQRQEEE